jgi:vancomycin aglycone glucosyltransferase
MSVHLVPELSRFLDTGAPPVYFGFGSMGATQDLGQVMVQTARALGRRAIVSRGWADLSLMDTIPTAWPSARPTCRRCSDAGAAVVHHGGAGTTAVAALAGTPQVIVPQIYDQHYWAGRIHDLGIGTRTCARHADHRFADERARAHPPA